MIKLLVCLAVVTALVHAKKELVVTNCEDGIIKITHVEDTRNPTGPITTQLRAKAKFSSSKEISEPDHYDIDISITLKLWAIFGYIPAPGFVYNMIGKSLSKEGELTYMGNGVFRAHCLFKRLFGQCMPTKGDHEKEVDLEYMMSKALAPVKSLMPPRGWYKMHAEGKTKDGQEALCFNLTFELSSR